MSSLADFAHSQDNTRAVGAGKDTAIWTKAPEVSFSEKDMTVTIDGKCHKLV